VEMGFFNLWKSAPSVDENAFCAAGSTPADGKSGSLRIPQPTRDTVGAGFGETRSRDMPVVGRDERPRSSAGAFGFPGGVNPPMLGVVWAP